MKTKLYASQNLQNTTQETQFSYLVQPMKRKYGDTV